MTDITTIRKSSPDAAPSGGEPLRVRERYLRRRRLRRRIGDRGVAALWVGAGALVSWLFVVGVAAFH